MKYIKYIAPIILVLAAIIVLVIEVTRDKRVELESNYYGSSNFIETTSKDFNKLLDEKKSFIFFTHNDYCNFTVPSDTIFQNFMKEKNFSIVKIPFEDFKDTGLYTIIKYAPSVGIVDNGKLIKFLDPNSDDDFKRYQDTKEFGNWIEEYAIMK